MQNLFLIVVLVMAWCFALQAQAQEGVAVDEKHFPDPVLLDKAQDADGNKDGFLTPDEVESITELELGSSGLASLEGIQYFQNLKILNAWRNPKLVFADLRYNLKLERVLLHTTGLKTVLLPPTPTLDHLDLQDTKVETLDASNCPKLRHLSVANSNLKEFKGPPSLQGLFLTGTSIETFDTSKYKLLQALHISDCKLTNLDVTPLTHLTDFLWKFSCENNVREFYETTINTLALPGFDMNRVGAWSNAKVEGNLVTFIDPAKPIRYAYLVGRSQLQCIFQWRYVKGAGTKKKQTISVTKKFYGRIGDRFHINAATDGDGVLSYDSDSDIVDIDENGEALAKGAGLVNVTVRAAETEAYLSAVEIFTIFINNEKVRIDGIDSSSYVVKLGEPNVQFHPTTNSDGAMSFRSSDESVIKVDDACRVSFVGFGIADLIIKTAKTENFHEFETRVKFKVQSGALEAAILTDQDDYPAKLGDRPFNLGAWTTGTAPIYYRSEQPGIASVDEAGNVAINGVGVAAIILSSPKTDSFDALEKRVTVTVSAKDAVLNVKDSFHAVYGDKPFNLAASSTDGKISYRSNNTNIVIVDDNGNVTIKGAGNAAITVSAAALSKKVTVTIAKKQAAIAVAKDSYVVHLGDSPFHIKAASVNKLAYQSSNHSVAVVDGNGNVTIKGWGTATITVSTVNDNNYLPISKMITITVNKTANQKAGSITGIKASYIFTYGQKPYTLKAKSTGKLSYFIKDKKVADVNNSGKIKIKAPGKTVLTITAAASGDYAEVQKQVSIKVKPATMNKPRLSASGKTLKAAWKKDSKVSGYEIWYAANAKFSNNKKVITLKKSKYTSKKLSVRKNKIYYVKMRSYKLAGKTKVYSSFSKAVKKKIK